MAVRRIKQSWWVDFRANHTRYRKRSPHNSRAGALAYESHLRNKLARGESLEPEPLEQRHEQTFEQFARQWMADYVAANNKLSEQRAKKYILEASLIPFFGTMAVSEITAHRIEQYKSRCLEDDVTNKTIKNRLTILNKCLVTAYEWLEIDRKPPRIKWPKCTPCRIDYLSPDECELLTTHAKGVIFEMLLMALRTGMRQGELRGLQWPSIDWQMRILTVRHSQCDYQRALVSPKSNRERHIPLDSDVYESLFRRKSKTGYVFTDPHGEPFDSKRLNKQLTRLCKQAGLRRITWHVLRHTFATQLAMKGVPLPTVQALLGHSSITTTMRYAHVAPSTLRTAIDMLNPKFMTAADFGQPVGNQWISVHRGAAIKQAAASENLSSAR